MSERYSVSIKELPSTERPRERLMRYGPSSLSTAELLAILLRTGLKGRSAISLAEQLLADNRGLAGVAAAGVKDLSRTPGIGPAKAVEIAASVELGRRLARTLAEERSLVCSPEEAAAVLVPLLREAREERFMALLLDTRGRLIRDVTVSVGSLDGSIVHPREVFRHAIEASAATVIVAHNHPSGDPAPSAEDVRVTRRLCEAGQLLGIEVSDHFVIGGGNWISLRRQGLM